MSRERAASEQRWSRKAAKTAIRIGVPAVVIWLVWEEIRLLDWQPVREEIGRADKPLLLVGALAVIANVFAMGMYDAVSFPRVGPLGFARKWGIGTLCFAWTNFLTIGPIGGPALRFLVYLRRGLTAGDVARGLIAQYVGFAAGMFAWLVAAAAPLPESGLGLALRICVAAIVSPLACLALREIGWRAAARRGHDSATVESVRHARSIPLGAVGFLDWGLSLASFWLIARAAGMSLDPFLTAGTFLGGHVVGMASMLPGGMGSADAIWLLSLTEAGYEPDVAAAGILLFRSIFYVMPWSVAVVVTLMIMGPRYEELRAWRPRIIGAVIAVYACFLLVASAMPAAPDRTRTLHQPPLLVEGTHLLVVMSAAALLALVPALLRRSGAALRATIVLTAACTGAFALRQGDPQETLVSILALLLVSYGRTSYRSIRLRGSLILTPLLCAGAFLLHVASGLIAHPRSALTVAEFFRYAQTAESARFLRSSAALGILVVTCCIVGYVRLRLWAGSQRG